MMKPKLIRITTVPQSLRGLLKGQLAFMKEQGFEVIGISGPGDKLDEVEQEEGVRVIPVMMSRKITPLSDLKAVFKLYKVFKKEKPLIVHTHTPKAGTLGMLAACLAGVPHRLHTVAGLPLLEATGSRRKLLDFVEKMTYRCATKVYPNSRGLYDIIIEKKYTKVSKLKVIANGSSNGIDTNHFNSQQVSEGEKTALRVELGISPQDFVFIFVGRLVGDKGINKLVKAFTQLSRHQTPVTGHRSLLTAHKLLLVGTPEPQLDPLSPMTQSIIAKNPDIILAGYQADVRPYFAISDALVFPSYREGFPNVVMQAGAMGLPSIVSNINGCNEIIHDGVNGLIIPVKDTVALKNAMKRLLVNKELRLKLQSQARELICKNYERERVWQAILEEYQGLITERHSNV